MKRRRLLQILLVLAPAMIGAAVSASPLVYEYQRMRHDPYQPVNLQALGSFPLNDQTGTENDIPEEFRKLDGTKVSVTGFMWAPASVTAPPEFQLVDSIRHPTPYIPQAHDRIHVSLSPGHPVQWFDQLVHVRGTLHVKLKRNDIGMIYSVYTLTDPIINPAPPPPIPAAVTFAWIWGAAVSALLCLVIGAPWLFELAGRRSLRNRRRRAGLCVRCGYDLRASPLRCPECGAPNATSMWYEIPDSDVIL